MALREGPRFIMDFFLFFGNGSWRRATFCYILAQTKASSTRSTSAMAAGASVIDQTKDTTEHDVFDGAKRQARGLKAKMNRIRAEHLTIVGVLNRRKRRSAPRSLSEHGKASLALSSLRPRHAAQHSLRPQGRLWFRDLLARRPQARRRWPCQLGEAWRRIVRRHQ